MASNRLTLGEWAKEYKSPFGEHLWCVQVRKSNIRQGAYFRAYANRVGVTPNGDLILWGNSCLKRASGARDTEVITAVPRGQWLSVSRTDGEEPLAIEI